MATLLLIGTDTALIEGISQTLTAAGHQLLFARSLADSGDSVGDLRPLVILVERSAIDEIRSTLRVPLAEGGAMLVFHAEDAVSDPLPLRIQEGPWLSWSSLWNVSACWPYFVTSSTARRPLVAISSRTPRPTRNKLRPSRRSVGLPARP